MMKRIILLLLTVSIAFAIEAFVGERTFTQQDGSTFLGSIKGDEWFNWIETGDGRVVVYNRQSRNFEYAVIDTSGKEERLVPSGTSVDTRTKQVQKASDKGKIDKKRLHRMWNEQIRKYRPLYR